jgi:hypothetical protein
LYGQCWLINAENEGLSAISELSIKYVEFYLTDILAKPMERFIYKSVIARVKQVVD